VKRTQSPGFTLLEVMVAVAILAMSLTAIFASEAGAIKMAHRSRKMGMATLLVRCKMGEIEEQVAAEGLPALFDTGSDACCEDAEVDGFTCDWEIEPIVLPDNMFAPEEGEEGAEGEGDPGAQEPAPSPGEQAQQSLAELDPAQLLAGGGGGALDGLASTALGFVFPILKPSFEQQIRRATVTVHWKEGSKEHSFDVTQYLVADQPIPIDGTQEPGAEGTQGSQGVQQPGGAQLGGAQVGQ
jgi:general secretion pathway protein I